MAATPETSIRQVARILESESSATLPPMAVTTAYHPATFCWAELGTTDVAAAKQFYGELFGWTTNELPMGEGAAYSMMQVDGRDAAAIYQQRPEEAAAGAPPCWRSYVAVSSADESARRIADAGGSLLAPPFDVFDAGRMAVAEDPTGA